MSIATARRLAAEHPGTRLPCPVCVTSVNADNLDKHLAKVHPGATGAAGPWRGKGALGVFPCSITIDGDDVVLRHTLGVFRRVVPLPCAVEGGSLWKSQPDAVMTSYADDLNVPHVDVRAGRYLRLQCPRSRISIAVGCRGGSPLAAHWTGWSQGGKRRGVDLVVGREAMVALEYELAGRGLLVPRVA